MNKKYLVPVPVSEDNATELKQVQIRYMPGTFFLSTIYFTIVMNYIVTSCVRLTPSKVIIRLNTPLSVASLSLIRPATTVNCDNISRFSNSNYPFSFVRTSFLFECVQKIFCMCSPISSSMGQSVIPSVWCVALFIMPLGYYVHNSSRVFDWCSFFTNSQ